MNQVVFFIALLPLIGFLVNGLFRKSLNKILVSIIGTGTVLASFILSLMAFSQVNNGDTGVYTYFSFIHIPKMQIDFAFQLDQLSSVFLLIITGVGTLIHLYSVGYMHDEDSKDFAKYFSFLNLFVFSMLLLVLGSNYVIMFIGWEGVGLCSYLLIGYWFKNIDFTNAAKKAFIMNRIGDLGFLLAVFLLFSRFGTADFQTIFANTAKLSPRDLTFITLFLFIGATGKSAQIPLYTWLPDAMAGPTPVSALIHAATMVTAGVYMIVRSHVLYSLSPNVMELIAIIGLCTLLLAASIAMFQNDIKKVLAYSTVSQLGYMFLALGVGAYSTSVFHVMTHAFFKALLFLAAGSVIHAMGGEQDITKMGGLRKKIPVTYLTFLAGVLAIIGFPFTSGFFSKDEILMNVYAHNKVYFYLACVGAAMTAFYMLRLFFLTFFGSFRGSEKQESHLHESPKTMTIPLVILAVLSIAGGWIQMPAMFGGHPYFSQFLNPVVETTEHEGMHLAPVEWSLFIGTILVLIIIYFFTKKNYAVHQIDSEYKGFKKVLADKWYVDELYDTVIVKPSQAIGKFFNDIIEKKAIDGFVNGIGRAVSYGSRQIRLIQNGQVGVYVLMMVIGMLLLFIIQLFFTK